MIKGFRSGCVALALVAAVAGNAFAETFIAGPPKGLATDYTGGSSVIKGIGSFSDSWSFTFASVSDVSGAISNVAFAPSNVIHDVQANFVGLGSSGFYSVTNTPINNSVTSQLLLTTGIFHLLPGGYNVSVGGKALGGGPTYGFNLQVTPVSDLESFIMFLAGIGLIGNILRRRSWRGAAIGRFSLQ
jgi:hypothetical protein